MLDIHMYARRGGSAPNFERNANFLAISTNMVILATRSLKNRLKIDKQCQALDKSRNYELFNNYKFPERYTHFCKALFIFLRFI